MEHARCVSPGENLVIFQVELQRCLAAQASLERRRDEGMTLVSRSYLSVVCDEECDLIRPWWIKKQ